MIKNYIIILLFVLCFGSFFYSHKLAETLESAESEILVLKNNNEVLLKAVEKIKNDKLAVDKKILELNLEAKKDEKTFNWNADISNTAVIKRLQSY